MKISDISNLRSGPRIRVDLPVRLRFGWRDSEEARASIINISEHGLCAHWHGPLQLGMEVKAILERAPYDVMVYRVVWVREAESSGHGYEIGLELKPSVAKAA